MRPTFWSQCCPRETDFLPGSCSLRLHELLEKHAHLSLSLLDHQPASACLNSVGTLALELCLLVSLALQAELRSDSFAELVTLCNLLLGQRGCCYSQMENLALAAVLAMRSVGRGPRVVALLFAPPAVAAVDEGFAAAAALAAAALAAVVYSQSPLGFGLVAVDTRSWETAENWTAALPIESVAHSPGSGLILGKTWD